MTTTRARSGSSKAQGREPGRVAAPVETRRLVDLVPADYNPRSISKAARERLRASLRRFGLASTLTLNSRTGRLVGGHQRLAVLLEELGPEAEVPVSLVDLDEADEQALNLTLNREDLAGSWDDTKLGELLDRLRSDAPDLLSSLHLDDWGRLEALDAEALAQRIAGETDLGTTTTAEERDALADRLAGHVRRIPLRRLDRAFLVALPLRRGTKVLVLADPALSDFAAEAERAALSGDPSPLASLGRRLFEADIPGEQQGNPERISGI